MSGYIIWLSVLVALFIVRLALGNIGRFAGIDFGTASLVGKCEIMADASDWAYHGNEMMFCVANGIGSSTKGRTASTAAVHTVTRIFELTGTSDNPTYYFKTAFSGANNAVMRYIPDGSAGTSLLSAVIKDGILYYALAGNCQIAVLRGGDLIQLSDGQTFDMLARRAFRDKKIRRIDAQNVISETKIYNYLGKDRFRELELFDVPVILKKHDIIVVMTDGVFDFYPYLDIENDLLHRASAKALANRIINNIERANHKHQDNATITVIKINTI